MAFTGGTAVAAQTNEELPAPSTLQRHQETFPAANAERQRRLLRAGGETAPEELAYLDRRYDEEMKAARNAQSTPAKIAHFELAYRYAVRARDLRTMI